MSAAAAIRSFFVSDINWETERRGGADVHA
jgi:hypothetical protein